jgi:hypothetical protein
VPAAAAKVQHHQDVQHQDSEQDDTAPECDAPRPAKRDLGCQDHFAVGLQLGAT